MKLLSRLFVVGFALMFLASCSVVPVGSYPPLGPSQVKEGAGSPVHMEAAAPTGFTTEHTEATPLPGDLKRAEPSRPKASFVEPSPSRGFSTETSTSSFTVPATPTTPPITFGTGR